MSQLQGRIAWLSFFMTSISVCFGYQNFGLLSPSNGRSFRPLKWQLSSNYFAFQNVALDRSFKAKVERSTLSYSIHQEAELELLWNRDQELSQKDSFFQKISF